MLSSTKLIFFQPFTPSCWDPTGPDPLPVLGALCRCATATGQLCPHSSGIHVPGQKSFPIQKRHKKLHNSLSHDPRGCLHKQNRAGLHGDANLRAPPSPPCGYPFFSLPPKPLSLQNRHLAPHFSACLGLEKQQIGCSPGCSRQPQPS